MVIKLKNKYIYHLWISLLLILSICFSSMEVSAKLLQINNYGNKKIMVLDIKDNTDYSVNIKDNLLSLNLPDGAENIYNNLNADFVLDKKLSQNKKELIITLDNYYTVKTKNQDGYLILELNRINTPKAPIKTINKIFADCIITDKETTVVFQYKEKPRYSVISEKDATIVSFLSNINLQAPNLGKCFSKKIEKSPNKFGGLDIRLPNTLIKSDEMNNQLRLQFALGSQPLPNANNMPIKTLPRDNELNTTKKDEVISLAFPWNNEVGLSVFTRGKYIWVAFDHVRKLDIEDLKRQSNLLVQDIIQLPSTKATILRITPRKDVKIGLRQEGLLWIVDLYTHDIEYQTNELPVFVQYDSMKQSYLYIPTTTGGNVISIIDPEIGDVILMGTNTAIKEAINEDYKYQDFEILKSKQGFALVPNASDVTLTRGISGFSIKGEKRGLNISDNLDSLKRQQSLKLEASADVFGLKLPEQLFNMTFTEAQQQLQEDIKKSKGAAKIEAKLRLAKYYLGMGLGTEALRELEEIKDKIKPETYFALTGIGNFLLRRYDQAMDDFSQQGLENNNQAVFWRVLASSALNYKQENNIILLSFISVIRDYPQELKERIALVAAETAIKSYDDISTQNFMDILKNSKDKEARKSHILYLNAQKFNAQGYPNNAMREYSAALLYKSQKYNALARYEKVNLALKLNTISYNNAIAEMQKLRFAWGEPKFKLMLLNKLAEVYVLNKEYNKALAAYQESLNLASSNQDEAILDKMVKLFEDIYMNNRADEMPPLKAIALYKDYEWLGPRSKYYTEIAQKVADRMVASDLLESAANILKEQLRLINLDNEQKAQIGARLALIYLFEDDNMAALKILDNTDAQDISANQQKYRKIIKAQALSNMKRTDEALDLLKDDTSKNALLLKTEIYWKSEQWSKAADTIKFLIEKPKKGQKLSQEQINYILDWILALKKSGKNTVVYRIRNTFLPYFKDTKQYATFNVLTSNLETNRVDMQAINQAVESISAYSDFSKIYNDNLLNQIPKQVPLKQDN